MPFVLRPVDLERCGVLRCQVASDLAPPAGVTPIDPHIAPQLTHVFPKRAPELVAYGFVVRCNDDHRLAGLVDGVALRAKQKRNRQHRYQRGEAREAAPHRTMARAVK